MQGFTKGRAAHLLNTKTSALYHRLVLGVRLLRITAWTLLAFGTIWWMLLTFLALAFGASEAKWFFLGGIGVLALPVGVLRLMRDHTPARSIGAGAVTVGMGVALAIWSELDEIVVGSQELGWIVIVIGFAGATLAALDRSAPKRDSERPSGRRVRRR